MRDVALISALSYRTLKEQKDEYPNMPHYMAPDEIQALLRPTTRKGDLNIHVISLAIIADKRGDFVEFMKSMPKHVTVISKEDGKVSRRTSVDKAVRLWGLARKKGASKAGGDARSAKALLDFWQGFSKIIDRWHGDEKSKDLLREADIGHHDTVRVHLGHTRWEWRNFSDAKRERVLKQVEKEVRQCLKNQ